MNNLIGGIARLFIHLSPPPPPPPLVACGDDDGPTEPKNTAPAMAAQTFTVKEDAAKGTVVGTVIAADEEKNDLTFSITSGNTGDAFAIAEGTGAITVAGSLDFETSPTYTLKVSVSDGELSSNADITVNVTDVEEAAQGDRLPAKDINTFNAGGSNTNPTGLWSDGKTMWVADYFDAKLYTYTLATGAQDATKEFDLAAENTVPRGLWSDGTTMWVADNGDDKLYAYTLATGARDADKEFDLAVDNTNPTGLWSDETTIWVADFDDDKLYAYTLATGARDAAKEFDLAEDNTRPTGLWSDGTTMWVVDWVDDKLYAYTLATGARDAAKEF
ncbi:MAG: cadherin repeat domain-containing protein, partial [Ekhidna sp.]|nr:cadherin repeat domain-containing protein [Ekhidna sp.]